MSPLFACCCQPHTAHKQWLSPACCCRPHVTIARVRRHQLRGAHKRFLSPACRHRLHITIARMSPSAAWCPRAVPVTCTSPLPARHRSRRRWPHGAPERCPSPARCRRPCVTIARTSPSAAWCPQAVPVTRTSPLPARHCSRRRWPHGAPKQCLSPAHRCCLRVTVRVTVGRTVPTSNACHPHVAVACTSLFMSPSAARCPRATPVTHTSPSPWMCHRRTQLEDAQSTILKYDVIFMVFEEGNKRCMFLYVPSTVLVS